MNKQAKIIFFPRVNIFLSKIKSVFTRIFLLPLKKYLADHTQPQNKPTQADPFDLNRQPPFAIGAASTQSTPEEEAIDDFFNNIQFEPVKNELHKWFFFGLAGWAANSQLNTTAGSLL